MLKHACVALAHISFLSHQLGTKVRWIINNHQTLPTVIFIVFNSQVTKFSPIFKADEGPQAYKKQLILFSILSDIIVILVLLRDGNWIVQGMAVPYMPRHIVSGYVREWPVGTARACRPACTFFF